MKVSDLEGTQLDYWVARAEGRFGEDVRIVDGNLIHLGDTMSETRVYSPSGDWAQGGQIIERERIQLRWSPGGWWAQCRDVAVTHYTKTPLIAAMRCFVALKFGDEVSDENLP